MPRKFKIIKILILEDDINALAHILRKLGKLKDKLVSEEPYIDFSVTILPEVYMVNKYINKDLSINFDMVLLDRDSKDKKSFHSLKFERYDPNKIVAISAVSKYNRMLRSKGIKRIVKKDYKNLNLFSERVIRNIKEIIGVSSKKLSI